MGLTLDTSYVEAFVERCLERIGEDDPKGERLFWALWEDEIQREVVVQRLKAGCAILPGTP